MSTDHEGTSALALEPRRRRVWARLAILPLAVAVSVALVSASSAGTHAASAPRCDVNDEHFTYFPAAQGGAGSTFEKFLIRSPGPPAEGPAGSTFEKSRTRHGDPRPRCSLRGFAKVEWLGKHGSVLPIKNHKD